MVLPVAVKELSARLGSAPSKTIHLVQHGTMQDSPKSRIVTFTARQWINCTRCAFKWSAKTGPLHAITVIDQLDDDTASLTVRLFNLVRIARKQGPDIFTGQVMRYLAELPFAPDAILSNRSLNWSVVDSGLQVCRGSVAVKLNLNDGGRVGAIEADRPRLEGQRTVVRPWRGWFSDYREVSGRWIPFQARVGWILEGEIFIAWRGTVTEYQVDPTD